MNSCLTLCWGKAVFAGPAPGFAWLAPVLAQEGHFGESKLIPPRHSGKRLFLEFFYITSFIKKNNSRTIEISEIKEIPNR